MKQGRGARWMPAVLAAGAALVLMVSLRDSGLYMGHPTVLLPGFHERLIANELNRPASIALAPDGRVFIVLQGGTIRVVEHDVLLPQPFLTLETTGNTGEGLFHVTFDPAFETNHWVYVYYLAPGRTNRLVRVTADGNTAIPDSLVTIWESETLPHIDHHGGSPIFDENGYIYFGTGDADAGLESRNLASTNGKVLRITPDGKPAPGNPFLNTLNARPEIYASGFRNPFTLARDKVTGMIVVNDVGQGAAEEIDTLVAGGDYGYPMCEGKCNPPNPAMQEPLLAYSHGGALDGGCAVVGGAFYQPAHVQFPAEYVNRYFYADLCSGWIRALDVQTKTTALFATGLVHPTDVKIANDGSLYYLARGIALDFYRSQYPGQLWRVEYSPPQTNE